MESFVFRKAYSVRVTCSLNNLTNSPQNRSSKSMQTIEKCGKM